VLRGGLSLGWRGCELESGGERNGTRLRVIEPPDLPCGGAGSVWPGAAPGDFCSTGGRARTATPLFASSRAAFNAELVRPRLRLTGGGSALVQFQRRRAGNHVHLNRNWELERRTPAIERRSLGPSPARLLGGCAGDRTSRALRRFSAAERIRRDVQGTWRGGAYAVTYMERRREAVSTRQPLTRT
jgi:hypothetical protein